MGRGRGRNVAAGQTLPPAIARICELYPSPMVDLAPRRPGFPRASVEWMADCWYVPVLRWYIRQFFSQRRIIMDTSQRPLATELPAWSTLSKQAGDMQWARIVDLFSAESDRLERFCVEAAGLRCDLSRTLCSKTDLNELLDLARQSGLAEGVDGLFGGELLNSTEQRAALHTALRGSGPRRGSVPYAEQIAETRAQIRDFAGKLRSGEWRGFSGEPIRNVVSIGIGGSHLGPAMVVDALAPFVSGGPRCHFVANVDPADLEAVLVDCVPASTLFVVASKTFTTLETIENARAARRWIANRRLW